jgi:phosphosulfolactate phosphohydrolase-like enzyme
MAELRSLREMEKELMQEINESSNSGNMCSLGRIQDVT